MTHPLHVYSAQIKKYGMTICATCYYLERLLQPQIGPSEDINNKQLVITFHVQEENRTHQHRF